MRYRIDKILDKGNIFRKGGLRKVTGLSPMKYADMAAGLPGAAVSCLVLFLAQRFVRKKEVL
jgi:hypothetical protein